MTVHCNRFLVNKTNRCTEFQFYWYYDSTCFGQPFCPSSGVLSRTSVLVHFMQLWWPFATRSRMELCTTKNSWWWAESLPEAYRVVIPIKLKFSASVGFIHKECDIRLDIFMNSKLHFAWKLASWTDNMTLSVKLQASPISILTIFHSDKSVKFDVSVTVHHIYK